MTDINSEKNEIAKQEGELIIRKAALAKEERRLLEAEHEALISECRLAKTEYERLVAEADELQRNIFRKSSNRENAERHLANHRASKPRASSYPTDEETASWQRELKRCEAAVERATAAEGKTWQACESARWARNQAKEKLTRLSEQEADMRAKLDPPGPRYSATTIIGVPHATIRTSPSSFN